MVDISNAGIGRHRRNDDEGAKFAIIVRGVVPASLQREWEVGAGMIGTSAHQSIVITRVVMADRLTIAGSFVSQLERDMAVSRHTQRFTEHQAARQDVDRQAHPAYELCEGVTFHVPGPMRVALYMAIARPGTRVSAASIVLGKAQPRKEPAAEAEGYESIRLRRSHESARSLPGDRITLRNVRYDAGRGGDRFASFGIGKAGPPCSFGAADSLLHASDAFPRRVRAVAGPGFPFVPRDRSRLGSRGACRSRNELAPLTRRHVAAATVRETTSVISWKSDLRRSTRNRGRVDAP